MKVLVYEYVTGGGAAGETPSLSLVREADLMVRALVSDLCEVSGIEVCYTRDARLPSLGLPGERRWDDPHRFPWMDSGDIDAVWPIAPETGGILERVTDAIVHSGRALLGSRRTAIRTCASKYATARRLGAHGLPVVPTYRLRAGFVPSPGRWVLKPDDGVGGEGTQLCDDADMLAAAWEDLGKPAGWVAQPYVDGESASLSLAASDGTAALLTVNRQRIVVRGRRFVLLACDVNALGAYRKGLRDLGPRIAAAVPGLWGYVGVDLIVHGRSATILEVNPRLTTSYAGLKQALGTNPVPAILARGAHGGARTELLPAAVRP